MPSAPPPAPKAAPASFAAFGATPQKTEALDIAELEEVVAQRQDHGFMELGFGQPVSESPVEYRMFDRPQTCSPVHEHMSLGSVGDVCTESAINSGVVPKFRGLPFDATMPAFAHHLGGNFRARMDRLVGRFPWLRRVGDVANRVGPKVLDGIAKLVGAVRSSGIWHKTKGLLKRRNRLPEWHELD